MHTDSLSTYELSHDWVTVVDGRCVAEGNFRDSITELVKMEGEVRPLEIASV